MDAQREIERCDREIDEMWNQPPTQRAVITTLGILDWEGEKRMIYAENPTLRRQTQMDRVLQAYRDGAATISEAAALAGLPYARSHIYTHRLFRMGKLRRNGVLAHLRGGGAGRRAPTCYLPVMPMTAKSVAGGRG